MDVLKAFLGRAESMPVVLVHKRKKVLIDFGEVWIRKIMLESSIEEIEQALDCVTVDRYDYVVLLPKPAVDYVEKKYGCRVFASNDRELLRILAEWFKEHAGQIKHLIKTGKIL